MVQTLKKKLYYTLKKIKTHVKKIVQTFKYYTLKKITKHLKKQYKLKKTLLHLKTVQYPTNTKYT